MKWYRKAADQGYAKAQFCLGIYCKCGYGTKKDLAEAAKWFRKAAEQGDPLGQSMLSLSLCHMLGLAR